MDARSAAPSDARSWADGGLISFEQAEAIEGRQGWWHPPRLVEAFAYLGAAALVIAVIVWYADLRVAGFLREPNHWGGFGVATAGTAVLAGVAAALYRERGPVARSVGVLLALAVVLSGYAFGAAIAGFGFEGEWAALVAALLVAAAALGARRLRPCVPTEVSLFYAAAMVVTAVVDVVQEAEFDPMRLDPGIVTGTVTGLLLWALGAAWIALGYRGLLRSSNAAYLLGAVLAVGAAAGLAAGVDRWWLLLLGATAAAVMAAGVVLQRTILMVPGVAAALLTVLLGVVLWVGEPPVLRTWVMIFGIPGLVLLAAAIVANDRFRGGSGP